MEALFCSLAVVGFCLIITAVLLYVSDEVARRRAAAPVPAEGEPRNGISYLSAFVVGIGQALAVLPGLSRSGTTISTGLLCGVRREKVAQFSFLMVLVPILGEAFLQVLKACLEPEAALALSSEAALPLALGFVSAFVSGLFACRVMIALVKKARLKWFALYCALAGAAALVCGILRHFWVICWHAHSHISFPTSIWGST